MPDLSFLDWPFFEERHRRFARASRAFAKKEKPVFEGD